MTRPFTSRELEVAALIAASRTTKQIAKYLGVNESRVRQLVDSIAAKIDADTSGDRRVVIALWWRENASKDRTENFETMLAQLLTATRSDAIRGVDSAEHNALLDAVLRHARALARRAARAA